MTHSNVNTQHGESLEKKVEESSNEWLKNSFGNKSAKEMSEVKIYFAADLKHESDSWETCLVL